jgi:hypothetical protein
MIDGMTDTDERTPDADTTHPVADTARRVKVSGDWLRFIPPVAALGTAFVLQVAAMTDTIGTAMHDQYGMWAYIGGGLLGLSVASCAEGGAAYLMDLYDKHLLAGDSVWMLRLTMFAYVAASAGVIHWWTGHRHLPEVISWVLAGMSASALYLWSRGSRWRRRDVMRRKGLIDDAMPRFTAAAKIFHPVRWFNTVRLISWEPARTPAEARARYDAWKFARTADAIIAEAPTDTKPNTTPKTKAVTRTDTTPDTPKPTPPRERTVRPSIPTDTGNVVNLSGRRRANEPTVEELADTLAVRHGQTRIGKPTALTTLRQVYGSCSNDRAIAAKDVHNRRLAGADQDADDSEPQRVAVNA